VGRGFDFVKPYTRPILLFDYSKLGQQHIIDDFSMLARLEKAEPHFSEIINTEYLSIILYHRVYLLPEIVENSVVHVSFLHLFYYVNVTFGV
jgi:hypothetical protein